MSVIRKTLIAFVFVALGLVAYDLATHDRAAWQSDYSRLKQGMAQGYANLDWQVEERDLDLAALDRETGEKIDKSFSRIQAYLALRDFIGAFRDPHLGLNFGDAPGYAALLPVESSVSPGTDCAQQGYENEDMTTSLSYTQHPDWQPLESHSFPIGTIGETGILRIAAFGENKYSDACKSVERSGLDGRGLQLATRAKLNEELETALASLKEAGATRLVIDVTGNGGGSEWIGEVAAMLSDRPLSRNAPLLADARCDRSAIWAGETVCPILTRTGERETVEGRGLWTGPIALLIDNGSASATEGFAVWLGDNDRAVLVGKRSFGAGCGYIDGGSAVQLTAAPLHVLMPNCARFTAAGVNEIEGIEPDIDADLSTMSAEEFLPLFDRAFP